ncbi:3'(2'),5'-bisphosphate nucleotidase CysQ [Oecophyllibacter saccharovorans]|uniref:3'(2'),5'-bisphosphate nucleotidase CysQ family protein n=1 Tax=Oecophyllibacter saccharovorans TaxID=2558360 RepID=UPI0011446A2D|nr:3'(2'),5'-bisphosphate nucleotidase CysQ [Oecophyllibacter saccharovorans]QDH15921.1 3'(2'),5'-bisphosphate nucleotidase CysQ [Oecophyllibacter saccharovorans]
METTEMQPPSPCPDDRTLLALAEDIVAKAADIVLEIRKRGFRTEVKADSSLVTEADKASEAYILARLREACPDIAAIGEEETAAGHQVEPGETYWLVDPLDGTRGFAAGRDEFAINIGLVRNGRAVLGVVAIPAYHQIYAGGPGLGVRRIDTRTGTVTPIHVRPTPPEGLKILSSSYLGSERCPSNWLDGQKVASVHPMGSAIKFVRIAEGNGDFYPRLGPTMEWDTAAPQAILEEAGGQLLTAEGQPLHYGKPGWKNPHFYCTGAGTPSTPKPQ